MKALCLILLAALPAGAQNLDNGRKVYGLKCAQCHGEQGTPYARSPEDPSEPRKDANGLAVLDPQAAPAAPFVFPRPRDFTKGLFKIRTTPSGEVPTDEDLVRIISNGMPGSSMPAWKGELADADIRDAAAFVKTFSPRFASEKPSKSLDMAGAVSPSKESIEKGRALFLENACNSCHGDQGRGDGPSAPSLQDEWGNPIRAANFRMPESLRGGRTREDVFRTFMTGLNGTPMPAYQDVFGDTKEGREKAWHLANYVASLGDGRPDYQQVLRAAYRERLPEGPGDPAWDAAPLVDFPMAGQVVADPRQFTPSLERVSARALYGPDELAILVEWDDRSKDPGDAVEIELPLRFAPPPGAATVPEKPYFLKGDPRHPVELWRWEAQTDRLSYWSSKGPKAKPESLQASGVYISSAAYADGLWRLYLRRKLEVPEAAGTSLRPGRFVPIAFFAWDGANGDQGLKCSVSTWNYLLLEPQTPKTAYAMPVLALAAAAAAQAWILRRRRKKTAGSGS